MRQGPIRQICRNSQGISRGPQGVLTHIAGLARFSLLGCGFSSSVRCRTLHVAIKKYFHTWLQKPEHGRHRTQRLFGDFFAASGEKKSVQPLPNSRISVDILHRVLWGQLCRLHGIITPNLWANDLEAICCSLAGLMWQDGAFCPSDPVLCVLYTRSAFHIPQRPICFTIPQTIQHHAGGRHDDEFRPH
jgi:hypothetical protein